MNPRTDPSRCRSEGVPLNRSTRSGMTPGTSSPSASSVMRSSSSRSSVAILDLLLFLVKAQPPRGLCGRLAALGHVAWKLETLLAVGVDRIEKRRDDPCLLSVFRIDVPSLQLTAHLRTLGVQAVQLLFGM